MALVFAMFFYGYLLVMARKLDVFMDMAASPGGIDRFRALAALVGLLLAYAAAVATQKSRAAEGTVWADTVRRFQRNRPAIIGLVLFAGVLFASLLAPLLSPYAPNLQVDPSVERYQPPSAPHPLGTDKLGRDVLSRVLYGSQTSLSIGLLAVCLSSFIGLFFGAVSGYAGGWIDDVSMRIVDGLLAFPRLLMVLAVLAFFSNSFWVVILLLGLTGWMGVARLVRGEVLRLKGQEFVQAAVAGGAGRTRLLWRHLLPNAMGPVLTSASLRVGTIIVLESSLSFLGLGVQPPTPSWGGMVSEGRDVLMSAWWVAAFPGLAVMIAVVSCNLVGDGLREATNPKTGA
jgi:peptide/nickel transport system permease protein